MKSNSRINKQQQVQVVIRLKPQSPENKYQRCAYLASDESNALVVQVPNKKEFFVFDAIANEDTSQLQLYQNIGSQAVTQSLEGYNCCIFAYGQTGSGKTYSILGILSHIIQNIYSETRGILPRLLEDLFKNVKASTDKIVVKCSYMEIYNEQIFDLLTDGFQFLQIRQGPHKGVYVEGINTFTITTYQQAINLLLQGEKNRKTAETGMNKQSSRSHTIFTINLESEIMEEDTIKFRKSKINIIDLAGSQRVKHTNVEGQRLRQGCNINKSLHVLGNVINALVESTKKKKHIPFRDSKLTYYLKDSLGGNSITKLLANIQCNSKYLGDTLSTLMFAKRAKILKMKVEVNENSTENYQTLRKQIKKLRQELAQAKYINETRLSDRFQTTENQTELNVEKFDTSNWEYSSNDKPIQVFQENQVQYKALIEIYEEHMKECGAVSGNENVNSGNNSFTKKKTSNILSHSEWKKLEKRNTALMNLIKRVPAFTKIYRENQLLKQERNQERKVQLHTKTTHPASGHRQSLSFSTQHRLPHHHNTTLSLQQDSISHYEILQQSYIPTKHQQELITNAVQKTITHYEEIILQMKTKFNECLDSLDKSYSDLQRQVQEKDRKIREISKRQYQLLPANIEELIDENQYLKLNVLELEAEMASLQKELEQNRIKQREEGRRYSLFQQPLSNKKIANTFSTSQLNNPNNWLTSSLQIMKEDEDGNHGIERTNKHEKNDKLPFNVPTQSIEKLIENSTQLELCNTVISSLAEFRKEALRQAEEYEAERDNMLECIVGLQSQCKRLMLSNKTMLLKHEDLKIEKQKLIESILQKYPDFGVGHHSQSHKSEPSLKTTQELWKQLNLQKVQEDNLENYKKEVSAEVESLYNRLKETQKIQSELNQFIIKQQTAQREFGKSINQILQEYAEILENKSNTQSISVNSRHSAMTSHKMLTSPRNASKLVGQFSSGQFKSTKEYRRKPESEEKTEFKRGNSKASSRASQEKRLVGVQSPKK